MYINTDSSQLIVIGGLTGRVDDQYDFISSNSFIRARYIISNFFVSQFVTISTIDRRYMGHIDIFYLDTRTIVSDDEIEELKAYLEQGGSLLLSAYGRDDHLENTMKILDLFGLSVDLESPSYSDTIKTWSLVSTLTSGEYGVSSRYYSNYVTEFELIHNVSGVTFDNYSATATVGEGKTVIFSNTWQFENSILSSSDYANSKTVLMNTIGFLL
eukprot:TRINITY_DN1991_c0_g1_i1.p1 TRINITY_DN1991_c0_g1~~TRINITY_DN1991_c0_g1_i1.p1  ORF type:complete len:214 (+),score=40.87 TRINITY_DN1991_c0_g1_i1:340-981(+)